MMKNNYIENTNCELHLATPRYDDDHENIIGLNISLIIGWRIAEIGNDAEDEDTVFMNFPISMCHPIQHWDMLFAIYNKASEQWETSSTFGKGQDDLLEYFKQELKVDTVTIQ